MPEIIPITCDTVRFPPSAFDTIMLAPDCERLTHQFVSSSDYHIFHLDMLTTHRKRFRLMLLINRRPMEQHKNEVLPGTLNLMVLKTLSILGQLHGYGIARRIEQISGNLLQLNQGTIYPALLNLEQMGWISSKWGVSENNRRAKYYSITRAGRKQLAAEEENWRRASEIMVRFSIRRRKAHDQITHFLSPS